MGRCGQAGRVCHMVGSGHSLPWRTLDPVPGVGSRPTVPRTPAPGELTWPVTHRPRAWADPSVVARGHCPSGPPRSVMGGQCPADQLQETSLCPRKAWDPGAWAGPLLVSASGLRLCRASAAGWACLHHLSREGRRCSRPHVPQVGRRTAPGGRWILRSLAARAAQGTDLLPAESRCVRLGPEAGVGTEPPAGCAQRLPCHLALPTRPSPWLGQGHLD